MIDLRPGYAKMVLEILHKHVPGKRVMVFGSRVTGKVKPYSDLDLAVMGEHQLPFSVLGALREDFMESDLPFRVDIVDWAAASKEFRNIIERDGKELSSK